MAWRLPTPGRGGGQLSGLLGEELRQFPWLEHTHSLCAAWSRPALNHVQAGGQSASRGLFSDQGHGAMKPSFRVCVGGWGWQVVETVAFYEPPVDHLNHPILLGEDFVKNVSS